MGGSAGLVEKQGMSFKVILAALATLALAGCGSLGCAANSNNQNSGGGCSTHVSF
jgi:hypothetical protein